MLGIVFTTVFADRDSALAPLPPSDVRGGFVSTAALPQFYPAALFPERYTLRVPVYADGAVAGGPVAQGQSSGPSLDYGTVVRIHPGPDSRNLTPSPQFEAPFESPQLFEKFEEFDSPQISPVEAATLRTAAYGGSLSEDEATAILETAGWPAELIPQALAVFCGINNQSGFPNGESRCQPGAVGDGGNSLGWAQLNGATWAPYCGITQEQLLDAQENAHCSWKVFNYDLDRGQAPWTQWSVKP